MEAKMATEILKMSDRINKIKAQIENLENFRAGSLSEQYNVCGKPGCRCKDEKNPKKHGPYYQISFYKNKKHTTFFVRKENVKTIKAEVKTYKLLKSLIEEWVALSTELSNLRLAAAKNRNTCCCYMCKRHFG